jgi:hypothetical protein
MRFMCLLIGHRFTPTVWADLLIGDIVRLTTDQPIPVRTLAWLLRSCGRRHHIPTPVLVVEMRELCGFIPDLMRFKLTIVLV